jgi:hypothetical protein
MTMLKPLNGLAIVTRLNRQPDLDLQVRFFLLSTSTNLINQFLLFPHLNDLLTLILILILLTFQNLPQIQTLILTPLPPLRKVRSYRPQSEGVLRVKGPLISQITLVGGQQATTRHLMTWHDREAQAD